MITKPTSHGESHDGAATPDDPDAAHLASMLRGHIVTQLIASAVRFRIPDLLGDQAVPDTKISGDTGIGLPVLRRYLSALTGIGLVEAVGPDSHRATPMARHLRRDTGHLYGQALMAGREYYDAWAELDFALHTGESAFERRHGHGLWAELASNSEVAASFTRTMRWNTERALNEILDLCKFPASGVFADLGAGDGTLTSGLLSHFPDLRAIVVEQPAIIDQTRRSLTAQGIGHRCHFIAGDLLTEVPTGAETYLLKSVIHNWNDELALRILENCRTAMGGCGRLLLIERAMNTEQSFDAAVRDIVMLVLFGSRDRTAEEYCELIVHAGFAVRNVGVGPSGICVVEATPG